MASLPRVVARWIVAACGVAGCGASAPDVTGKVCMVLDLRSPGQCGAGQSVDGLQVEELLTNQTTTTTADGSFRVELPDAATTAVLRVAADRIDRRTSLVGVDPAPAGDVLTPVITTTLWNTYLGALGIAPDDARATIHVSFTKPGLPVGSAQVAGATQLLYNQGAAFTWGELPPGDQTVVFLALGVPVDTGLATVDVVSRSDQAYHLEVPVEAGAITWVHIEP